MTTGTDEHAEKIEKIAMIEGLKAKDFVKKMRPKWHQLMDHLNIGAHQFIHTDDSEHHKDAQRLFLRLKEKNQVKKGIYEGWYNVREARFVPELEAKKSNYLDSDTGDSLEKVKEDAWFSHFQNGHQKLPASLRTILILLIHLVGGRKF